MIRNMLIKSTIRLFLLVTALEIGHSASNPFIEYELSLILIMVCDADLSLERECKVGELLQGFGREAKGFLLND